MKSSVDVTTSGALMGKSVERGKGLLEEMTSDKYHWSSESASSKKSGANMMLMQ